MELPTVVVSLGSQRYRLMISATSESVDEVSVKKCSTSQWEASEEFSGVVIF